MSEWLVRALSPFRLIRLVLRKPPWWGPTLKGPLRPLWPVYKAWAWWLDSYHHYRYQVGLWPSHAFVRATIYEIRSIRAGRSET